MIATVNLFTGTAGFPPAVSAEREAAKPNPVLWKNRNC
jgi:hypothetical protein